MLNPWTKTIEAHGIAVRLYERNGAIYRAVALERVESGNGKAYTRTDRKSLGHSDRKLAEQQAKALAEAVAKARLTGKPSGRLTFGQLRAQYTAQKLPMLTPNRQRTVRGALNLLQRHMGLDFPILDFDQHLVDRYVSARASGSLRPLDHRAKARVRPNTIRNELQALSAVCNWATGRRLGGQTLLASNPIRLLKLPHDDNMMRPRATRDRFEKLVAVAGDVDPAGHLRLLLEFAWRTGRRINAILHLRASDVLLTTEAVQYSLSAAGQDEGIGEKWPGGLRWRAEWDKKGYETFSPLPAVLRPILAAYMRERGVIGDGWLFLHADGEPVNKARAGYLLKKAEAAAGVPPQARGGWHAFRRGWATLRKSMPVQDVMAAGGWRDPSALQMAYQGADSATILGVTDLAESA